MEEHPLAAQTIIQNAYMDDIPGSTDSTMQSAALTKEIEDILAAKGFKIKEWVCSYLSNVPIPLKSSGIPDEIQEGVLGVIWSPKRDTLKFDIDVSSTAFDEEVVTKRKMLSFANKIYDPIGLLTPVTVRLKILIRLVWACEPKV